MCNFYMILLSWNIRGLRRPEKRSKIKSIVRVRKVDVLLIQETKRSSVDENFAKSLWPWEELEYMEVGADGSAGGLLCLWNPQIFELKECCSARSFVILADMQMLGRQYTWCNAMDGNRWSRIDRFLIDPRWLEEFKFKQWGLPRFLKKLGHLKVHLKRWNSEVFGNIEENLKKAEEELHEWDLIAEERNLLDAELRRRVEVRKLVWDLGKKKDWLWLQKSRRVWAENGDRNTRFFHLMATKRQRKNLLDSVNVNGVIQDEPGMIKRAVVRHFKLLFNEEWKNRPKLSGFFASINSTDSAELLEAEFLEDEIWEAIKGCDGNKAPGPDGFNLQCIQKCWNIMKGLRKETKLPKSKVANELSGVAIRNKPKEKGCLETCHGMLSESTGEDDPEEIQQYVQRTDFLICIEEGDFIEVRIKYKVSATRVLQETCDRIRGLHREVDDLRERLFELFATTDSA
ncbi:hypothetical protein HYC85_030595 [Camellia sinensis]|uniref:Endonuclease/exonuclease/phosphatase domain-containing protein n=1 Tax=Camellia sinensis TaxID=4442 RepID=A0A7J7G513_CAMSI|nr:hypothetical protein HYC85_030595 [Camellia sinensis]